MSAAGPAALLDLLDAAAAAALVLDRALARIGLGTVELRMPAAVAAGGVAGTSIRCADATEKYCASRSSGAERETLSPLLLKMVPARRDE